MQEAIQHATSESTPAPTWAQRVAQTIEGQKSILCVGLDPVWEKLPVEYKALGIAQGILAYNRDIIDGTAGYAAAFKPQYKCYTAEGEADELDRARGPGPGGGRGQPAPRRAASPGAARAGRLRG